MRLIKAFSLAALAAVAAMAFVGTTGASAGPDVTLCKVLVEKGKLCPDNNLFPKHTNILGLAENLELVTSSGVVKCPHSEATILTLEEIGNPVLGDVTALTFGTLTNSLGGCTTCPIVHTKPPYPAKVEVTGEDDFWITTSGSAQLLNCFGLGITCEYGGEGLKFLIDPDFKKHPSANFTGDVQLINNTLTRTGGSAFCPGTGKWIGEYIVKGCVEPGSSTKVACYVALDDLV
jgi:hypothetical protein